MLATIVVFVRSVAVGHVVQPVPEIYITIGVNESAVTRGYVLLPGALVLGTIRPNLNTSALSQAILGPLSVIDCFIIHLNRAFRY